MCIRDRWTVITHSSRVSRRGDILVVDPSLVDRPRGPKGQTSRAHARREGLRTLLPERRRRQPGDMAVAPAPARQLDGLTATEASRRLAEVGPNVLPTPRSE